MFFVCFCRCLDSTRTQRSYEEAGNTAASVTHPNPREHTTAEYATSVLCIYVCVLCVCTCTLSVKFVCCIILIVCAFTCAFNTLFQMRIENGSSLSYPIHTPPPKLPLSPPSLPPSLPPSPPSLPLIPPSIHLLS